MNNTRKSARRQNEIEALERLPDEKIDTSDFPEIRDWDDAVRGRFYRPVKQSISLRLDADVLAWFKARNDKYQSKINEVLRDYMRRNLE